MQETEEEKSTLVKEDTLVYDSNTGELFRVRELSCTHESGKANRIWYGSQQYQATHVIFKLMTGRWPNEGMLIDHIDGNPFNNAWSNLREVTRAQNNYNRESCGRWVNTDIPMEMGVQKKGNSFTVQVNGIYIGSSLNLDIANNMAREARAILQGPYARGAAGK